MLIVGVSLSRSAFDREHKGCLYARAGISDFWIVDVRDRRAEVYRELLLDGTAPFGWRDGHSAAFGPDERVAPLERPAAVIAVADPLP